ncbi:MAG: molecular chaperone HtpG [Verrucomicrobiae bacterium]|nr:molecular chaperone HtpG [Verrucomicrobiae bacterium]
MSKHQFQTEVNQLLHLIIHSLYSHKEIFMRELVSNASDALDKLKYLTLTDDRFKTLSFDPAIKIEFNDKEPKTLTISDNGIGMNEADLVEHLGTIARSGTKTFLAGLSGDGRKDSNLIGQFGVGFYSAFMVASLIEVTSRKAGEDKAWKWTSTGKGEFEITEAVRAEQGSTIVLHLNEEGAEYASRWAIEDLIKKYSNHIAFPIFLTYEKTEYDDKGQEKSKAPVTEKVNSASALWKRPKNELKDEDYKEFYKTVSHDMEDPLFWTHTRAEGILEYTTLFYVPKKAPFDMGYADYKPGVKLFVRRVFITDDDKELLPVWLRFIRGVIDSEDLPLNVSREILQQNKVMMKIKNDSVKKLLGEFEKLAKEKPEEYREFIGQYNRPLKEGLYSDFGHREELMELVRFKSSKVEGWTSFAEYQGRMQAEQKAIYFITGDDEGKLRASPLLEAYKKKDIEVLIMADNIDEVVIPSLRKYKELDLKAVNRSDAGADLKDTKDEQKEKEVLPVAEKIKKALGDRVRDVKVSVRLSDSPSCVVTDESDPTYQMQAMMRQMGRGAELPEVKPILEINPDHAIVTGLKDLDDEEKIADVAVLLLDQALLMEGVELKDTPGFVKRLNRVLGRAI